MEPSAAVRHEEETAEADGLSLVSFAAVHAALAEGFPLAEVLEARGIAPMQWARGSETWRKRLAADSVEKGRLLQRFAAARIEAEDAHERRLKPVDEDAGAFVDLAHAVAKSRAPVALLDRVGGLTTADMARLERRWAARAAADPSVAAKLEAARAGKRHEPVRVLASPRVLVPSAPVVRAQPIEAAADVPAVALPETAIAAHTPAAPPPAVAPPAVAPPPIDDTTLALLPAQVPKLDDRTMTQIGGALHAAEDGFRAELTAVPIPDLDLTTYAMFQAEIRIKGQLDASMSRRYGVASAAVQRALEQRYREVFAAAPEAAQAFAAKVQQFVVTFSPPKGG